MSKIPNAPDSRSLAESYVTWSDNDPTSFAKASKGYTKGINASQPLMKSTSAIANRFQGIDANTSVRDAFGELDYDFFRPNEQVPRHFRDIISACLASYQKVPVIKQVIDLMGDFTVQGIKLVHKNESIERFYNEWFRKVNGPERSERIANVLYRAGNVIVKRADAKLNPQVASQWKSAVAETDLDHEDEATPGQFEVPYKYTIINPLIVEVLGEHVAAFTGKVHYVLKLPTTFYNTLSLPLTSFDPSILTEGMPRDLQQAMDRNDRYLLLDSDKLILLFYKKDDWDVWAYPILYSLLDEIILLQKMKRADMTALDGVISHIRVWKLGSMEHKIFPTDAAITKLSNILLNHLGGGAMDLVWGPDLELAQTSTDIANFLGSEKYEFCMNTIHGGLGIPAAIGGKKGKSGGMTEGFMSLRILIERLKYGRQVITRFWEQEIKRVQQAMGFRYPAQIYFDNIVISDETSEKALWLQLVDRDLVTVEAVQERFGRIPEIENILLMREQKKRAAGKMPVKVSPYVDAQPDLSLLKIGMQAKTITPSELEPPYDLKLKEPSSGDQQIKDNSFPPPSPVSPDSAKPPKKKGVSGEGRPNGSKDTKKRKARIPKPMSKAADFVRNVPKGIIWQTYIDKVIDPYFLHKYDHKAVAEFTPNEAKELTLFKLNILLNCDAEKTPSAEVVKDMLDIPLETYDVQEDYIKLCKSFQEKLDRKLTGDDLTMIRSYLYALVK